MIDPTPRKLRPRLSLLNLLLLTAIVAQAILIALMWRDFGPLQVEVRQLRKDTGRLTIDDPKKYHAIAARELTEMTWTRRVYLPPGRNYFVGSKINDLPPLGEVPRVNRPPSPRTIGSIDGGAAHGMTKGEWLVTLAVRKSDDGSYRYQFVTRRTGPSLNSVRGGTSGSEIRCGDDQWPRRQASLSTTGVMETMVVASVEEPLVLLDLRSFGMEPGASSSDSNEGAIVWIEAVPGSEEF